MRRLLVCMFAAAAMVVAVSGPAAARGGTVPPGSNAYGASLVTWEQRWMQWTFASSTNPFFNSICGEQVGKLFFLNAAFQPGEEFDCHISPGTALLASPGGFIVWADPGQTAEDIIALLNDNLPGVTDGSAVLDGQSLPLEDAFRVTDVFTMQLEPGNFIQAVDPLVVGSSTLAVSGGWFLRIRPLTPGEHELVLSDRLFGTLLDVTFHITVG